MDKKSDENVFYKNLGESIRDFRKNANISQEALANHVGLSRVSMLNIEKGKQKVQIYTLYEIAFFLNTTLEKLMPQRSVDIMADKAIERVNKAGGDPISAEKLKGFIEKLKNI